MASILLWTFVLQLVIHVINTFGASSVNELLWQLYKRLPIATSKAAQDQLKLQREVLRLNREISGVSAQDEFSKWAKLRRQLDKAKAEYDKSASSVESSKTKFDRTVNAVRWISTNGLRLFLQYWYSKTPMFWIPKGWVPNYVEWILSFPRAPQGSISIQLWQIACASVIGMVSEAALALYAMQTGQELQSKPQAFQLGMGTQPNKAGDGSKKEL